MFFLFFFLSLSFSFVGEQMNRPIQVKPADSDNRGGKCLYIIYAPLGPNLFQHLVLLYADWRRPPLACWPIVITKWLAVGHQYVPLFFLFDVPLYTQLACIYVYIVAGHVCSIYTFPSAFNIANYTLSFIPPLFFSHRSGQCFFFLFLLQAMHT